MGLLFRQLYYSADDLSDGERSRGSAKQTRRGGRATTIAIAIEDEGGTTFYLMAAVGPSALRHRSVWPRRD